LKIEGDRIRRHSGGASGAEEVFGRRASPGGGGKLR
jgi:hypothetical protein